MHPHPHWILSAEKQKEEALQRESPLSSCLARGGRCFLLLPSFLPTVERDVNTINPRPKSQASIRIPALLWLEARGPRERRLRKWRARRQGLWGGQGEFLPSSAEWPLAGVLISGARRRNPSKASPEIGYVFWEFSAKAGAEGYYTGCPQAYFTAPAPFHSWVQTSHAQVPEQCRHWFSVLCTLRCLGTVKSSVIDGSYELSRLSDE